MVTKLPTAPQLIEQAIDDLRGAVALYTAWRDEAEAKKDKYTAAKDAKLYGICLGKASAYDSVIDGLNEGIRNYEKQLQRYKTK